MTTGTIIAAGVAVVVIGGVAYLVVTHKPAQQQHATTGKCGQVASAGIAIGGLAAGVPATAGVASALGNLACSGLPLVGQLVGKGAREVAHLAEMGAKAVAHETVVAAKAAEHAAVKGVSVGLRIGTAVQTLGLSETKPGKVVVKDAKKAVTTVAKKASSVLHSFF